MADLDRRVATEARGARDARARLRALLRACLEVATASRDFWTVFIELWGEALHDRELARLNRRTYARARRLLAAGVARGERGRRVPSRGARRGGGGDPGRRRRPLAPAHLRALT